MSTSIGATEELHSEPVMTKAASPNKAVMLLCDTHRLTEETPAVAQGVVYRA